MCITLLFFYFGRSLIKLADGQCFLITKSSIYHIKQFIQPFKPTIGVDRPEAGCEMEVSTMYEIYTYCLFTKFVQLCTAGLN